MQCVQEISLVITRSDARVYYGFRVLHEFPITVCHVPGEVLKTSIPGSWPAAATVLECDELLQPRQIPRLMIRGKAQRDTESGRDRCGFGEQLSHTYSYCGHLYAPTISCLEIG